MPSTSTHKSTLQYLGLGLFAIALLVFTGMLGLDHYNFTPAALTAPFTTDDAAKQDIAAMHQRALTAAGENTGLFETSYGTTFAAEKALKETFYLARTLVDQELQANGLPEGKQQWEVELPEWQFKSQRTGWIQGAAGCWVFEFLACFFFFKLKFFTRRNTSIHVLVESG